MEAFLAMGSARHLRQFAWRFSPPTAQRRSEPLALVNVVVVTAISLPLPALLVAIVVSLTIVIVAILVVVSSARRGDGTTGTARRGRRTVCRR